MSKQWKSVAGMGVDDGVSLILKKHPGKLEPDVLDHAAHVIARFLHANVPNGVWERLPVAMVSFDRDFETARRLRNCTAGNVNIQLKDEYDIYNAKQEEKS